ncbi:MAG: cyclic nucleotide-binding domain-containing protein [Rhodospirillaceae bacterium]|nr:cyclic nucleotide-binding domain-containing protein [Rhodospirillaceae bacterium]MBT4118159.1 cyclic nucleotide-binding domain-containing protein [Rhodospirillaceae bacterium]MBT4673580.1 cyclic nucleotide-binding domain-containing protein [Rhodospirillaceae bacterium]MBT4720825.1 cyclic nucleotide-binding domain-containing protein [Rhodospirillaceae bacterium]MBT4750397.1 cyclic nucleotide-binding domain-containing protein [Rhodospirillaceae bacterium]
MSDEQRKYSDGEVIFREGQRSSAAFIVVSGRVELLKSSGAGAPVRLSILGPGEMFGEMGVVNRATRSVTARAAGDTVLQEIEREGFMESIRYDPDMALQVIDSLSGRLRSANEMVVKSGKGGGRNLWDLLGTLIAQRRERKRMLEVRIAPLTGDADGTQTQQIAAILGADNTANVKILTQPLGFDARVPRPADFASITAMVRMKTGAQRCDLMIWGSINEVGTAISLHFIPGALAGDYPGAVLPTDRFVLPADFQPEFGQLLRAVVLAAVVPKDKTQRMWLEHMLMNALEEAQETGQQPPAELTPSERAMIQACFGNVIAAIGNYKNDANWYTQAGQAYADALEGITAEEAPFDWAAIQFHLGRVRQMIAEKSGDEETLQVAMEHYRAAMTIYSQAEFPLEWATAETRIGSIFYRLDRTSTDTEFLKQAIASYQSALLVFSAAEYPFKWSEVKNNLGQALQVWGDAARSEELLERAVTSCHEALRVRSREETPQLWAASQNNLGSALFLLGRLTEDSEYLEGAAEAFGKALEIYLAYGMARLSKVTERNLAKAEDLLRARLARRVARVYWEDEPAGEREERLKQLRSRANQSSEIEA